MRIGILKETQLEEKRVSLTPAGVKLLVDHGHQVFIEKDAGLQSRFTNDDYEKVGAKIVYSAEEAINRSELVVKVAPFTEEEASKINSGQIVFSFLHLFMRRKVLEIFLNNKVTSIGFELVEDEDGILPILSVMSEIAGQMSIQIAARYLEKNFDISRGMLLGGISGVAPAAVVILGAGGKKIFSEIVNFSILNPESQYYQQLVARFNNVMNRIGQNEFGQMFQSGQIDPTKIQIRKEDGTIMTFEELINFLEMNANNIIRITKE